MEEEKIKLYHIDDFIEGVIKGDNFELAKVVSEKFNREGQELAGVVMISMLQNKMICSEDDEDNFMDEEDNEQEKGKSET